jgi:3-oxoacyl-[acyl-carrier protein] reductase
MAKVAVITAASRGIGAATARAFGKAGYDVVVNYNKSRAEAEKVVADVKAAGQNAIAIQADVFTEEGVQKLFTETTKTYKTIDILINNAGLPEEVPFGEYNIKLVTESLMANVTSAVLCSQAVVPLMPSGGQLLFTGSIWGLPQKGSPSLPLYSAGKAAITSFAETMAEKFAAQNIRCNVVAPGYTKTPNWDGVSEAYAKSYIDTALQKEWVEAEEIAAAFLFLAQTYHVNASTIVVDGGWAKRPVTPPNH